jgi:UDP-MurNAc hydroxylase
MKVTYLGHACIMVESGGSRILMDPWLTDPTYHGTWWHYPPLAMGVKDLPKLDYLYISHEHPDHFDPPTLEQIDKNVQVFIANYRRKRFRDRLRDIGFKRITELEFGEEVRCNGEGLSLRLIPPDRTWDDSAILLKDGRTTVLNVNDCHLDDVTLAGIGETESVDLAFLTFTGASQYPGCFEFPLEDKIARWRASKTAHLEEFVSWATLLKAKRAVPAAGNFALLAPDQLFMNTSDYVNTPQEAVDLLHERAPHIEGLQMNPGDVWTSDGTLKRLNPPPDWNRRIEDIEALSRRHAAAIADGFASEPQAPPNLYELFHSYFTGLLLGNPEIGKQVNIVTWWVVSGPQGGDWVIDFTREHDWVYRGVPPAWNLKLTFPAELVYQGVTGRGVWDNLVLSFRLRLARNPDRYMKEFWTWLCKL